MSMRSPREVSDTPRRHRVYAADEVFRGLATDILQGVVPAGATLPPERELSHRFGVSKLLVRQAVHRLAEMGLVAARQGGATRALDPRDSGDLRVIELLYTLAPQSSGSRALLRDVLEKQYTQGLSLVEVFGRRAPAAERAALVEVVEASAGALSGEQAFAAFERAFWSAVASGGGNRVLRAEVRWWYGALAQRPSPSRPVPSAHRFAFYRELARRLRDGRGAVDYYLASLQPGMEALFRRPARGTR
jgi:GntR family transcriptional repressor for pyruvate dehydrogenase complex